MSRLPRYFLVGCVLVQAIQMSLAAITNVSRGKNTTQSSTYKSGTSDKAVDGNYNNTDLEQCATLLSNRASRSSSTYTVKWEVDLGEPHAIASVTIYNTAVLPESLFTRYMSVCAVHRNNTNNVTQCITIHTTSNSYRLPPGGNVTIHFSQLLVADVITISKSGFLTLCEVDVLGTKVVFAPEEDASVGKATNQSGTIQGRFAHYAVDGNINTTDLNMCASAFNDKFVSSLPAWWQVNLGDFYLVTAITVYFPAVYPDSLYPRRLSSFISFNDSLPRCYSCSGPGTCYYNYKYVDSSGVATFNCTQRRYSRDYLLTVGRYVTIMPYSSSTWAAVLTVCEVTVTGVRQNISADDPALAVFSPTPRTPTTERNASHTGTSDHIGFPLSIAAIAISAVFALLCIIFIVIVIIKLKGGTKNKDATTPAPNAYQQNATKKPKDQKNKQKKQPQLELQRPVTSEEMYANTALDGDDDDDDDEGYEYISETDVRNARRMPPKANTRY